MIAGGGITQTGAIQAGTLSAKTLAAGTANITLTNAANNATTVNLQARNAADTANAAGAISYTDTSGFDIATINTTGATTLSATAAVTQSGVITAAGLALNGTDGAFTLNAAGQRSHNACCQYGPRQLQTSWCANGWHRGRHYDRHDSDRDYECRFNLMLNNAVDAGATGDALILKAGSSNPAGTATGGQIINNAGAAGIVAAAGRYLAYSGDPSSTTEGVTAYDKRYNADASFVPGGGASTFIYRIAPTLTTTADAGQGKIYDGSAGNAPLTFGTSGLYRW